MSKWHMYMYILIRGILLKMKVGPIIMKINKFPL